MQIDFPLNYDATGRTAQAGQEKHIRDMVELVLFTSPGERVNRPDFGCGLLQLIFGPNSSELAAATQFLVQGSLQKWLGDLIQVQAVEISAEDSTLRVIVKYIIKQDQQAQVETFFREV